MRHPVHAVVPCVDYHDFLDLTLPRALSLCDRVSVITSPEDTLTAKVCRENDLVPWVTDAWHRDDAVFDKGSALNEVLPTIKDGWVLLLDADILLPGLPNLASLHPAAIHGCRRRHVIGLDGLHDLESGRTDFPLMRAQLEEDKELPIGFFQLFRADQAPCMTHPASGNAASCDLWFTKQWHPNLRTMLDFEVWHLDSIDSTTGQNWWGRTTPLLH
jgi:hypothetical protein